MAKVYLSADNSRGGSVTAANPTHAHIRGWDAGVRVEADKSGTRFDIYMTNGSNGCRSQYIGEVRLVAGEPEWSPVAKQYPYVNANGETLWACCESTVGPICEHLAQRSHP